MARNTVESVTESLRYQHFIPDRLVFSETGYGNVYVEVLNITTVPHVRFAAYCMLNETPTYFNTLAEALQAIDLPHG